MKKIISLIAVVILTAGCLTACGATAPDAASEGINLHNFCKYMIHVEIPWNPNVMEQRNGRIDRHGQRSKSVYIWHPVGKGFDANASRDLAPGDIVGDGHGRRRVADGDCLDLAVGRVDEAQLPIGFAAGGQKPLAVIDDGESARLEIQ